MGIKLFFSAFLLLILSQQVLHAQDSPIDDLENKLKKLDLEDANLEFLIDEVGSSIKTISENDEIRDDFDVSDSNAHLQDLIIKTVQRAYLAGDKTLPASLERLNEILKLIYPVASPFIFKITKYKSDISKTYECEEKNSYPDCLWEVALDSENIANVSIKLAAPLQQELANPKLDTLVYLILSVVENDIFKLKSSNSQCLSNLSEKREISVDSSLSSDILIKRMASLEKVLDSNSPCKEMVNIYFPQYAVKMCENGFLLACKSALKVLDVSKAGSDNSSLVKKALIFSNDPNSNSDSMLNEEVISSLSLRDKLNLLIQGRLPSKTYYILSFLLACVIAAGVFLYKSPTIFWRKIFKASKKSNSTGDDSKGYLQMTEKLDEYSTLLNIFGLTDEASNADIKKAYRNLMKQLHPDSSNVESQAQFERVQQAYDRIMELRGGWFGISKD